MSEKLVKQKRFIDEETGEIFEAVIVGKPYWKKDKGFIKVYTFGLEDLAKNEELIGKAGRLLLWIIAKKLNWNSYEFYLTEKEALKELGISRATYYRWLDALIKAGLIEKIAINVFRLKPYLAIKGHNCLAEINANGEKYTGVDF
jgi:hypothetical protein